MADILSLGKEKGFLTFDELYEYIENNNLSDEEADALFASVNENGISMQNEEYDDSENQSWDSSSTYDSALQVYMNETRKIPILPREQQLRLFEIYRKGGPESIKARKKLIECNLPLVISIAKKYRGRGLPFEDLIQEGNIGLMKAIEKYDVNQNAALTTYATFWIRQKITRAIAESSSVIKVPIGAHVEIEKMKQICNEIVEAEGRVPSVEEVAQILGINVNKARDYANYINNVNIISLNAPMGESDDTSLSEVIADPDTIVPSELIGNEDLPKLFDEILSNFSPKEKTVIQLRFGLTGKHAMTLEEIGINLNITRERVRQIESKALRKLRSPKYARLLADFRN